MIAIDFETFYSRTHTIGVWGPWGYAQHPDTDVYMVSVVGEGIEFVGHPSAFDWSRLNGKHLVSHNAGFDMTVAHAAVDRGLIPAFDYASWSCSADLMANQGYPRSLADATKASFDVELPKVMRQWMSGRSWDYAVQKGRDKQLLEYALNDSRWCLNLWDKHSSDWPETERQLSAHTRGLIWRGVTLDVTALERGQAKLRSLRDESEDLIPWKNEGPVLSLPILKDYCLTLGVPAPTSLAKDSDECQAWEDKWGGHFAWIEALRNYRRSNILLNKVEAMLRRVRPDGTMPVYLKYWGAHPGRWSGDAGVNLQNLPRGEMFGVNLRHTLIPRAGHKFVICDLSQIEPRVLFWLAGDREMLDAIKSGVPLYEAHARNTMGWTGGKLKDADPAQYQLAKARVLGLGYGCGWRKFVSVAKALADLDLPADESERIVSDWRRDNQSIVRFWKKLGGKLEAASDRGMVEMEFDLPSGRAMRWWHPRPDPEGGPYGPSYMVQQAKGKHWLHTWGGKMTENVVQGLSRDIFAHHLMEVERAGIPVTFSVHDELVCEVPEDQATDALEEMRRIMSTPPPWIKDLPLAAEGSIEDRYTK